MSIIYHYTSYNTITDLLFNFGRAMVYIDDENWYADDGQLSRIVCELAEETSKTSLPSECCACDDAKYKVIELKYVLMNNIVLLYIKL